MRLVRGLSSYTLPLLMVCTYIFLYIPIIVLILFSFNNADFPCKWQGFTLMWYRELFYSEEVWEAALNSLIVAGTASFLSLLLGSLYVFYGSVTRIRTIDFLFYINLMIPEVVLALGLISLFTLFSVPLGFTTLIAGHTVLGLGYTIPILSARFDEIEQSVFEASLDLGASVHQTFKKIILPILFPALLASGLLVFIISLEDFLITFFCAGSSVQTLSLYIFAMIRSGISPTINALSTILLLVSSFVVIVCSILRSRIKLF